MTPHPQSPEKASRGGSSSTSKPRKPQNSTLITTPTTKTTTKDKPTTARKKPRPTKGWNKQQQADEQLGVASSDHQVDPEETCQCTSSHGKGVVHENRGACEAEKVRGVHVDVSTSIIFSSPQTTNLLIGPSASAQTFTVHTALLELHTGYFSKKHKIALKTEENLARFAASSSDQGQILKRSFSLPSYRIPKREQVVKPDSERNLQVLEALGKEDWVLCKELADAGAEDGEGKEDDNATSNKDDGDGSMKKTEVEQLEIKLEPNTAATASNKISKPPQTPSPEPAIKKLATLAGCPTTTNNIQLLLEIKTESRLPPPPLTISYPHITPLNFAHFTSWLYTGTLIPVLSRLTPTRSPDLTTHTLITLHVFSIVIACPPFSTFILQSLLTHPIMTSGNWPSPADAKLIYSISAKDSVLRKLCAECVAKSNPFDKYATTSEEYKQWEAVFRETGISMDFAKASSPRWSKVDPWAWSERGRYFGNTEEKGIEERWDEVLNSGMGGVDEIKEDGERGRFARRVQLELLDKMKEVSEMKRKRDFWGEGNDGEDDYSGDELMEMRDKKMKLG